jgi:hypothetical protein
MYFIVLENKKEGRTKNVIFRDKWHLFLQAIWHPPKAVPAIPTAELWPGEG